MRQGAALGRQKPRNGAAFRKNKKYSAGVNKKFETLRRTRDGSARRGGIPGQGKGGFAAFDPDIASAAFPAGQQAGAQGPRSQRIQYIPGLSRPAGVRKHRPPKGLGACAGWKQSGG